MMMMTMVLMGMLLEQLSLRGRVGLGLVSAQPKQRQIGELVTKFGNTIGQGGDGIFAALRRWKGTPQGGEEFRIGLYRIARMVHVGQIVPLQRRRVQPVGPIRARLDPLQTHRSTSNTNSRLFLFLTLS